MGSKTKDKTKQKDNLDSFDHQKVESKWKKKWNDEEIYRTDDQSKKEKFFCLDMFPYPSGAGLHVGHMEGYTASDIYSRYMRAKGFEVLHPMGWDAFGLPSENYAIKNNMNPKEATEKSIETFKSQQNNLGLSYDWEREIGSCWQDYYKWTQWMFLFLYKKGLAYRKKAPVNWCPSCKTVLANEQVIDGLCERCDTEVENKDLNQWFFKITEYANRLVDDLKKVDWPESTKEGQRNWIGRSEGALIKFGEIEVFTTRPDTIFGATYLVLSPEHPLVIAITTQERKKEVERYQEGAAKKSEVERMTTEKSKEGVFTGYYAVNPASGEKVPVWIADYVMMTYGTGAIMGVPAHDERDFQFAKRHDLPITPVISVSKPDRKTDEVIGYLKKLTGVSKEKGIPFVVDAGLALDIHLGKLTRAHNDLDIFVAKKDIDLWKKRLEAMGFSVQKRKEKRFDIYAAYKGDLNIDVLSTLEGAELRQVETLVQGEKTKTSLFAKKLFAGIEVVYSLPNKVLDFKEAEMKRLGEERQKEIHDLCFHKRRPYPGEGVVVNSGKYSGMGSEEFKIQIIKDLAKKYGKEAAKKETRYKIRDWLISRQRYWGAPIPIIHCEKCGEVPVSEKDLPVLLPDDVEDYQPKGKPPLANSAEFTKPVKCPKCGAENAKRELDTMDTFVCSSWYHMRFADPKNDEEFCSEERLKKWLPVDFYLGGAEHTVGHLCYARFFTKALNDADIVDFDEPYTKLRHIGMVLAEDGRKMSKRWGNVINPDDVVDESGADTARMYTMFMGPLAATKPWSTKDLQGVRRFVDRMWRSRKLVKDAVSEKTAEAEKIAINRLIKRTGENIEKLKFNVSVSDFMIFVNEVIARGEVTTGVWKAFVRVIAPFAPFISEELWDVMGEGFSVHQQPWPEYDETVLESEDVVMAVQVNGKVRGEIEVSSETIEKEAVKMALEVENVKKYAGDVDKIKKVVYVPGRILNLII